VTSVSSQIIVGTASFRDEIREKLEGELKFLEDKETIINFQEKEEPPWTFF